MPRHFTYQCPEATTTQLYLTSNKIVSDRNKILYDTTTYSTYQLSESGLFLFDFFEGFLPPSAGGLFLGSLAALHRAN